MRLVCRVKEDDVLLSMLRYPDQNLIDRIGSGINKEEAVPILDVL
jgi:hypothetical protein